MPTRYLKPGIRDSDRIEAVQDPNAEILYYRLLIVVDDFGRTDARPLMVKSECFPIRERVNADKCMQWLKELDSARLIGLYEVEGKPYLQIAKWDNKPRALTSKYPEPPADVYKRMQMLPVTVTVTVTETVDRKPELKPETGTKTLPAAIAPVPKKSIPKNETELQAACKETWICYCRAYFDRYQTEPVRNAKVNSAIKLFVQRIGLIEAPGVAAFYVLHNEKFYVQKMHPVELMLKDAEGLRTQWVTRQSMTSTRAGQIDKTQSNFSAVGEAMKIMEAKNVSTKTA